MLDVRRMQILRAVVTSGSVSAAAAHLGYTPSAISQQMTTLEKEAGITLLERHGRGIRPTAAGALLTGYAATIGTTIAEAEAALADLRAGRTGRLAIRYFPSVGSTLVAPALTRLRDGYPGLQIDLRMSENDDPLPEVERGGTDLALVLRASGTTRPGIRLIHLLDDPYQAVLPAAHPLAARRVIDLADLAAEHWVGSEPPGPCLDLMLNACAAAGFSPNFVATSEDYATALGFVAAAVGVCLIPQLGLGPRRPGTVVRRVRHPEPVRTIHAAVRDSGPVEAPLAALIEALRGAAADQSRTGR